MTMPLAHRLPAHSGASPGEAEIGGRLALCDPRGALYLPDLRLMAVSDLHLEKGSSFARRRIFLPPYDTAATLGRLQQLIDDYRPAVVISLGDSFHDIRGADRMAPAHRGRLLAMMAGRDWVWVAGNHDPEAPPGLPGQTVTMVELGGLVFCHQPSPGAPRGEVCGHLHPGVRLVRRGQSIRRRCFASDGRRMVLPAFGAYTGTLNILGPAFSGLFHKGDLSALVLGSRRIYRIGTHALAPG